MNQNHKNNDKKIIFISSYPKSGNTWVRILISALLNNNNGLFEIKDLEKIKLFHNLPIFHILKKLNTKKMEIWILIL